MSLLDPNSIRYEISWIDDQLFPNKKGIEVLEDEKQIGIVKKVGFQAIKSKFAFFDNNGSVFFSAYQTRGGFSMSEYLDDGNGEHLGIVTQPLSGKKVAVLKDISDKEILIAFGKRSPDLSKQFENYQIKDPNDNVVAKVSLKIEEIPAQKKRFLKRSSTKYSCFMEILDEVYDRKILLGFFTLILVHLYNYRGEEGVGVGP